MIRQTTHFVYPLLQHIKMLLISFGFIGLVLPNTVNAQTENPFVTYEVPFQNLLKFNRFLINPTFSSVREDKSYINLFHRNQSANFENNPQNYFLSYSGRINGKTSLGLSLYNQQEGVISNLGVLANYSYGVQLSRNTNLSFGVNIPYYTSSFDQGRAVTTGEDPLLNNLEEGSILSFQPGLNVSLGRFDFGVFAQNLADFNLKKNSSLTSFSEKIFSGHLQYVHNFENGSGIFENGRLLPLVRTRIQGNEDPIFGGGVILDLPRLGWLQGGYDQIFGASVGTGFNLNKRLSFGYNFEKNTNSTLTNFGTTHEISIAFSFQPNSTTNAANLIAENTEENEKIGKRSKKAKVVEAQGDLALTVARLDKENKNNNALIDELIFKLDSLEQNRQRDLERRFDLVMRVVDKKNRERQAKFGNNASALFLAKTAKKDSLERRFNAIDASKSYVVNNVKKTSESETAKRRKTIFAGGESNPIEKFIKLDGVGRGHYIVANVFKNEFYLKRFMKTLAKQGLVANYFKNPDNGLNYVYLARYENDTAALEAYESRMEGKYKKDIWIMHVDNSRYSNLVDTKFVDEN